MAQAKRKQGSSLEPQYDKTRCPKCDAVAEGPDEIEEVFGTRHDGTKPQSYCRACRVLSAAESRRRKREAKAAKEEEE